MSDHCKPRGAGGKARRDRRPDACAGGTAPGASLAWRAEPGETPDPYRVWLSEVLLQQTTAQAATPYYQAFVETWPTVEDLAAAPIEAVISAFAGLGYYSRARNLHACAREVAAARRPVSVRGSGASGASRRRRLYGGRDRRDRLRPPGRAGRRQYRAHPRPPPRRSTTPDRGIAKDAIDGRGAGARPAPPRRRFRPGADGHRRDPLPAPQPGLRSLSAQPGVRRVPLRARRRPIRRKARGEGRSRGASGAVFFAHRADGAFLARRRPPKGLLASTVELPGTPWTGEGPGESWARGGAGRRPLAPPARAPSSRSSPTSP